MTGRNSILSHSKSVVTTKTGNDYVIVPLANNIADMTSLYTLNETGAFIWEKIDGKRTVGEIIRSLTEEFDVDNETASDDVFSFINEMSKYLVVNEL